MKRIFFAVLLGSAALGAAIAGCSGTTCDGSKGSGTCFSFNEANECSYTSGNTSSCNGSESSGHCPSTNPSGNTLIGCCVTNTSVLGCSQVASDCYYNAILDGGAADPAATMLAANAKTACGSVSEPTTTVSWTTSPP